MNPQSKAREFWLFKNGVGCANPDYQSLKPDALVIDDFIHVIEFEAYRKAVEALKWIRQDIKFDRLEDVIVTKIDETLRDLGVE